MLASACTQTFGLDQVLLDDDRDGVLDDADNCPQDFNPRQQDFDLDGVGDHCAVCAEPSGLDSDGDGIDDACDACVGPGELDRDVGDDGVDDGCEACPEATGQDLDLDGIDDACDDCLRGPPLDEDGDGVANACDDCPSRPDPMQAQTTDDDRLGDACDPDGDPLGAKSAPQSQTQRMFDPFIGLPGAWTQLDATISDGIAHLPKDGIAIPSPALSTQFLIETKVRFPIPDPSALFEMHLDGTAFCPQTSCGASVACTLDGAGHVVLTSFTGEQWTDDVPLDTSGPIQLWFRSSVSTMSPDGGLTQICVGVDSKGTISTGIQNDVGILSGAYRWSTYFLASSGSVDLDYMWLVSN